MTNRCPNYRWYFITIYVPNRNLHIEDLENILSLSINNLKNIAEFGYLSISTRSNNEKLKHPHMHLLIKTNKNINYQIFISSITRKIRMPISCRIYIVDDYKYVKRYIDKHEVKYIYRKGTIYEYEWKNAETEYLYFRRHLECIRGSFGKEAKIEKSIITGIYHKGLAIGWI